MRSGMRLRNEVGTTCGITQFLTESAPVAAGESPFLRESLIEAKGTASERGAAPLARPESLFGCRRLEKFRVHFGRPAPHRCTGAGHAHADREGLYEMIFQRALVC